MDARNAPLQAAGLREDAGSGPAIVFLRGDGAVSKAAPVLAGEFRVLSFAVAGTAAAADVAGMVAATLNRLAVAEVAVIAATAAAGVALELTLAHPDLVRALTLISPRTPAGELAGRAAQLKAPVQLLFGTRDAARPPDAARTLCRSIPNCSLVYVFDAAQALDDERPEAVAAALAAFALKREKYLVTGKSGQLYP